jgi:hypothetical protein
LRELGARLAADPATLPAKAGWYLVTNLPRPGGPREAERALDSGNHVKVATYGWRTRFRCR